MFGVIMMSV
jgi:hypothetical protein